MEGEGISSADDAETGERIHPQMTQMDTDDKFMEKIMIYLI
jgi:hypothetical protein